MCQSFAVHVWTKIFFLEKRNLNVRYFRDNTAAARRRSTAAFLFAAGFKRHLRHNDRDTLMRPRVFLQKRHAAICYVIVGLILVYVFQQREVVYYHNVGLDVANVFAHVVKVYALRAVRDYVQFALIAVDYTFLRRAVFIGARSAQ